MRAFVHLAANGNLDVRAVRIRPDRCVLCVAFRCGIL